MTDWQPTATLATLRQRADLLTRIRAFFAAQGIMEVDTPVLGARGVTEPNIDTVEARVDGEVRHLQRSPEYSIKRLLAARSAPIHSLGKAVRDGERGSRHNPQGTLLQRDRPHWRAQRGSG